MSEFWAKFIKIDKEVFRFDTRIYLAAVKQPQPNDHCIGAIVGKNPGSAEWSNNISLELQYINLNGDKLLPTVRNIIRKAYETSGKQLPKNSYVQVLNLFYLCEKDLKTATNKLKLSSELKYCESEMGEFKWVWYLWGGNNKKLNEFKGRFANINAKMHFFVAKDSLLVTNMRPTPSDFAKHTQGMKQQEIIGFISKIL